jgi:hypothetical protein
MWKPQVKIASSNDSANRWHRSENGGREYHVCPNQRNLNVADLLQDGDIDPHLSFHMGLTDLPLDEVDLGGAALAKFPQAFMHCKKLVNIHCSNVGLYTLPKMFVFRSLDWGCCRR